jgi:hypothetical protein
MLELELATEITPRTVQATSALIDAVLEVTRCLHPCSGSWARGMRSPRRAPTPLSDAVAILPSAISGSRTCCGTTSRDPQSDHHDLAADVDFATPVAGGRDGVHIRPQKLNFLTEPTRGGILAPAAQRLYSKAVLMWDHTQGSQKMPCDRDPRSLTDKWKLPWPSTSAPCDGLPGEWA